MKWTCVVLMLLPTLAFGQQQRSLTVGDAIKLALENNRTIHTSWKKVEAADARWGELNASRFPQIKLQAGYTRLSEVDAFAVQVPSFTTPVTLSPVVLNNYSMRLSLQQTLFTGFRLDNTVNAAEYTAEAAQHDYARDKAEVVFSTKAAYWNLFKAIEFKRLVSETVEQLKAHLTDIENFMKQGLATRSDVLKVRVQLSNSRLAEIDAANAVKLAMMALNNLIGQPLETAIQLVSTLPDSLYSADNTQETIQLSQRIRQALNNRSELMALQARVRASEASVKAARGSWYPQIYLAGNYYYARPNQRILPTKDEFRDTWDIGVNVSFDVWNWMTTAHQTTQAEAAFAQTQDALALATDAVTLEVTQNYLEVMKAREKLDVSRQGSEQAEESYRITRSKFTTGLATNTDLLDSEVALLQAKTNQVVARVDLELAMARLTKSIGESEAH